MVAVVIAATAEAAAAAVPLNERVISLKKRSKLHQYSATLPVFAMLYTVNSENKPRGLYFSKALFEGLIYGGKFAFQNRLG